MADNATDPSRAEYKKFVKLLRDTMKAKNVTQRALAELLDINPSRFGRYMSGQDPDMLTSEKVTVLLNHFGAESIEAFCTHAELTRSEPVQPFTDYLNYNYKHFCDATNSFMSTENVTINELALAIGTSSAKLSAFLGGTKRQVLPLLNEQQRCAIARYFDATSFSDFYQKAKLRHTSLTFPDFDEHYNTDKSWSALKAIMQVNDTTLADIVKVIDAPIYSVITSFDNNIDAPSTIERLASHFDIKRYDELYERGEEAQQLLDQYNYQKFTSAVSTLMESKKIKPRALAEYIGSTAPILTKFLSGDHPELLGFTNIYPVVKFFQAADCMDLYHQAANVKKHEEGRRLQTIKDELQTGVDALRNSPQEGDTPGPNTNGGSVSKAGPDHSHER